MSIVIMITFFSSLYALELPKQFLYENSCITSKALTPNIKKEFELFCIAKHKTKKRVKASDIVLAYKKHGFETITTTSRYINFLKKSPVDVSVFKKQVKTYFLNYYPTLKIKSIMITPRSYILALPNEYKLIIQDKSYRSFEGTFYLIGDNNRFYFDYEIDATMFVVQASQIINKKDALNSGNTKLKNIHFVSFKSRPIDSSQLSNYEALHRIKKNKIITIRDIKKECLIRRHEDVIVLIKDNNIQIEFSAKAVQDGGLHDMILIEKPNGRRMKAKVIGHKRVEI